MAYAAVITLKQTIKPFLNPSHIWIDQSSSRRIIQPLYDDVCSLQEVLKELDSSSRSSINRKRVNALDGDMRDAVREFEDVVESRFSNHFQKIHGEEEINHPLMDLQELKQDIDSFTQNVNKMKATYIHELRYPSPHDDDADDHHDSIQSRINVGGNDEWKMVGLSDCFMKIKEHLTQEVGYDGASLLSVVGMAGIGKTTLAKKLFHDPLVSRHFARRAFVTLGPKYRLERVLRDILKQVNHHDLDGYRMLINKKGGEEEMDRLRRMISESLMGRRYLIVLDDVWDVKVRDEFKSPLLSCPGPNVYGSQVMVTTRLSLVGRTLNMCACYDIDFLNKKESWDLLRRKVFDEMPCSNELEKAGKKIAENCEGLPLTIVTVADILSNADKTTEYWSEVAANKQHSVFVDAYDRMFEVLYPSYDYSDQHLKPCFLYAGVFPQNCEISSSRLINLWVAEGFAEPYGDKTPTYFAWQILILLILSNVVLSVKKSIKWNPKTSGLLSPFWHLCNTEAAKNKFFRALYSRDDGLAEEAIKIQRRLCIRNNVLFGIKDVFDSIASVSTVRSLLCTGSYHPYPVPVCLSSRLLMILDALTVHFSEFPNEVALNLLQLTYLALTFDGKIPPSISKLWNLHYLIVDRKLSIVECDGNSSSYLPIEIWELKELEYLKAIGRNLPHPPNCEGSSSLLPNLVTLLDVSPHTCTNVVFKSMPNLQNLGIEIELDPDENDDEPFCFFDHIPHLQKLKKLKCTIVNPNMIVPTVAPLLIFPPSLVELTLSGLGYPWEEMNKISSLPNLQVLKLRCYAFRCPKWDVRYKEFIKLKFLLIEDTDLAKFTFLNFDCVTLLRQLSMRHCYKLEEIPSSFAIALNEIELVDCNPVVVGCAKKIVELMRHTEVVLNLHSSCD